MMLESIPQSNTYWSLRFWLRIINNINENGKIIYSEQVQEVTEEPDYKKALEAFANA